MLANEWENCGAYPGGQYHRNWAKVIANPDSKREAAHRAWQRHITEHQVDS